MAAPGLHPASDPQMLAPTEASARRLFTVDEFLQMCEQGIIDEDERLELLDGEIIEMAALGIRHEWCVDRLTRLLISQIGTTAHIRIQGSLRLTRGSLPQPDLLILKWRTDEYAEHRPTAADVLLLIEVSDSTLANDRRVKGPRYAQAGIPEYWIVNLVDNQVEVYTTPKGNTYTAPRIARSGDSLTPTTLPTLTLAVDDILR